MSKQKTELGGTTEVTPPDFPCTPCACECETENVVTGPGTDAPADPVPPVDVGNYSAWGTIPYGLCNIGPQIQFEGQFNSYIRGINGWQVGYLDENKVPPAESDICNLDVEVIMDALVATPCNLIGDNSTPTPTLPGYYNYEAPGVFFDVIRLVAVFQRCCDDGSYKVYIIKVNAINAVQSGSGFTSEVLFDYACYKTNCWKPTTLASDDRWTEFTKKNARAK